MPDDSGRRIRLIFTIVAIFAGGLYTWTSRNLMTVDGVAYLDIADAYRRADWNNAINAYYSPLYSWLLAGWLATFRASAEWEAASVHVLNFCIFFVALLAFEFLMREVVVALRTDSAEGALPADCYWYAFGYSLFLWASLVMIGVSPVTPDLSLSAFVYAGVAIVLRLRRTAKPVRWFALLGLVLGFGYLAKSPMFIIGLGTIAVAWLSCGRRNMVHGTAALLAFLAVTGPFIGAISRARNRLTISEAAGWNYAFFVNGYPGFDMDGEVSPVHWQGLPSGTGTPLHPTRRLATQPPFYVFSSPISGSYPPIFDPSYWYEGLTPHFDLRGQLRVLADSFRDVFHILFYETGALPVVWLMLLLLRRQEPVRRRLLRYWFVWTPAILAFALYAFVHVEPRYSGPFVVILGLGLFMGIRLPERGDYGSVLRVALLAVAITTTLKFAVTTIRSVSTAPNPSEAIFAPQHWQIAEALSRNGVGKGDRIAVIGLGIGAYWARLAGVQIVADIPNAGLYWSTTEDNRARLNDVLRSSGVSVLVGRAAKDETGAWKRLADTGYSVLNLK